MTEQKPSIGRIVHVRDRSKPAGAQVFPAIIHRVHDDKVISATGFFGMTIDYPSISQIDGSIETDILGWYWPPKV